MIPEQSLSVRSGRAIPGFAQRTVNGAQRPIQLFSNLGGADPRPVPGIKQPAVVRAEFLNALRQGRPAAIEFVSMFNIFCCQRVNQRFVEEQLIGGGLYAGVATPRSKRLHRPTEKNPGRGHSRIAFSTMPRMFLGARPPRPCSRGLRQIHTKHNLNWCFAINSTKPSSSRSSSKLSKPASTTLAHLGLQIVRSSASSLRNKTTQITKNSDFLLVPSVGRLASLVIAAGRFRATSWQAACHPLDPGWFAIGTAANRFHAEITRFSCPLHLDRVFPKFFS